MCEIHFREFIQHGMINFEMAGNINFTQMATTKVGKMTIVWDTVVCRTPRKLAVDTIQFLGFLVKIFVPNYDILPRKRFLSQYRLLTNVLNSIFPKFRFYI